MNLFKRAKYLVILLSCSSCLFFSRTAQADSVTIQANTPQLLYQLKNLYHTVVQKSVIQGRYIYALQESGNDTYIRRAEKPRRGKVVKFSAKHELRLKDFGHTQTWLNDGHGHWLVGAKPQRSGKYNWDIELARVAFPKKRATISDLNKIPHLTNLCYATDLPKQDIKRAEAAISPNRRLLLIASIDKQDNAHFALYRLAEVNRRLNQAAKKHHRKDVDLRKLHQLSAFHIDHFFGPGNEQLNSVQGYDLGNDRTIYISSELAPRNKDTMLPRKIVKIPWGQTQAANWQQYELNHHDWHDISTELEGIELNSSKLHLTVAYHKKSNEHPTLGSYIFRVSNII